MMRMTSSYALLMPSLSGVPHGNIDAVMKLSLMAVMFACAETGRFCSNFPGRRSRCALDGYSMMGKPEIGGITGPDTTRDGVANGTSHRVSRRDKSGYRGNICCESSPQLVQIP